MTLALVPTVYENSINNTHARGFQLQYIAATVGGTVRAEQVDPIDGTEGRVALSIRLRPLEQEYKLSVTLVRTLIELIAQLMALGSGLSFLCRLTLWLYLRTMHSSAAKLGTRVHASVVRRSQVPPSPTPRHPNPPSPTPWYPNPPGHATGGNPWGDMGRYGEIWPRRGRQP